MEWNGSYLGSYDSCIIRETIQRKPFDICLVNLLNMEFWCAVQRYTNVYPCIVDELLPVFGIKKLGTHSITIGGLLYILINVGKEPILLKDYDIQQSILPQILFKQTVQDLLVLKMLLGSGGMNNKDFVVVKGVPYIYHTCMYTGDPDTYNIPHLMRKKWFGDNLDAIGQSIMRLTRKTQRTHILRESIQAVINRIHPSFMWLDNLFITKIMRYE